ncbi:ribose 1,5-bisphosphokinase [Vibrio sp. ZSDZ65]|uniref:Ribose 1,5-bisphosphate phosphokinase PhnN n=1 Tax=Vibrio qingdaonensis TaxID=2829491 RepID=A0A9X3CPI9_9VIBR|nr:ribose 1,5-bisphosphokinase [Vibrio qingdaonensis]MCW8347173.1 ribose 1,5-bisphosphokinase [Vibrio qingdaonensis]
MSYEMMPEKGDVSARLLSSSLNTKVYYVIGPSGSGKDTLIDAIRAQFADEIVVAHRYITRPADAGGENHVALSHEEFASRKANGLFALHWQAHGLCYGVGVEINTWLEQGLSVVVNGSRAQLEQARRVFSGQLIPVVIEVEASILRQRLTARARENNVQIEQRLQRANAYSVAGIEGSWVIDNSGSVCASVMQFQVKRQQLEVDLDLATLAQ